MAKYGTSGLPRTLSSAASGKSTQVEQIYCPGESKPPTKWPGIDKIVSEVSVKCDPETNKPWIVSTSVCYDHEKHCWEESCEGVYELPVMYKAPVDENEVVTLPDFNGVIEAYDTDGEVIELIGGMDLPANFAGSFLCMNDQFCYFAEPLPIVPEVQIGGEEPALDSGVKTWINNGIHKYPTENGWTQVNPYGSKS